MRFFFSTVGLHNPALTAPLPEHMAYPVSQRVANGLDLDYTPLLLGDGFIMDSEALARIREEDRSYLQPMAKTLTRLEQAGLLTTFDMGEIIGYNKDAVLAKTGLLLQDPSSWLDVARKQWATVRSEFAAFQASFGRSSMREANVGHLGVENWLARVGRTDDAELRSRLMAVLEADIVPLDTVSREDVRGILTFMVSQVVATDLIRHVLGCPFINWSDSQEYYDRLYATRWDTRDDSAEYEVLRQARLLFDVVIPELRPGNIDQVIRFVQDDKVVASLRRDLFERLAVGEDVSQDWLLKYVNHAVRRGLISEARTRQFKWLGAAAGAALPGASFVQDLAKEAAIAMAQDNVEELFGSRSAERPQWYYALQQVGMR